MLTCRILTDTIAKQSTEPASRLGPRFKGTIKKGDYEALHYQQTAGNHFKVTFRNAIPAVDGTNYKTWCIYGDYLTILDEFGKPDISKDKVLDVPYYSQRDNVEEWWRTCNTSSHAMLVSYLKPGAISGDDDYYRRFVKGKGDSTDWAVHTRALASLGIKSEFRTNLSYADIDKQLALNIPVAIGVLHKGTIGEGVFGGHVLVVTGRSGDNYMANDPYGYGFSYANHNGHRVEYPKYPTLDARWMPGQGYGRIIESF